MGRFTNFSFSRAWKRVRNKKQAPPKSPADRQLSRRKFLKIAAAAAGAGAIVKFGPKVARRAGNAIEQALDRDLSGVNAARDRDRKNKEAVDAENTFRAGKKKYDEGVVRDRQKFIGDNYGKTRKALPEKTIAQIKRDFTAQNGR